MILLINTRFEIDSELADQIPSYVKIDRTWITKQVINVSNNEMILLLSLLNVSSNTFDYKKLNRIDNKTLVWD